MSLEEVVRPNTAPDKSAGFKSPSTAGVNGGAPTAQFGHDVQPVTPPFATTEAGNDMHRWPQAGISLANGEELASVAFKVSGGCTIDPNVLSIWNLEVLSVGLAVAFTALTAIDARQASSIWNGATRVRTIQVNIKWLGGATTNRTVDFSGVLWEGGIDPGWTTGVGLDVVQIQIDSLGRKLGFVSGLDMKEIS